MPTQVDVCSLRKTLGWSQSRLATELGVSKATISRWESGEHKPSSAVYARLCELSLKTNGEGMPRSIRQIKAGPQRAEVKRTVSVGETSYKARAFEVSQDYQVMYPQPLSSEASPPAEARPIPNVWLGYPKASADSVKLPNIAPLFKAKNEPDSPRPAGNRKTARILMKVAIPVLVAILLPFLFFGVASADTESGSILSLELPQILSRIFPDLETFVQQVTGDITNIGNAYMKQDPKAANPGVGPEESLEKLLGSLSELNKEVGAPPDQGLFDKVINSFREMRQQAWSGATSPR